MPQSKKLCFIITWEGLGWVTKTLCTKTLCPQKEANAFSLWNNNLGYQGILEFKIEHQEWGINVRNVINCFKIEHQEWGIYLRKAIIYRYMYDEFSTGSTIELFDQNILLNK
jgi:hypothetical protein